MKRTGFALLTLIVPVLCALDIEQDAPCVPSAEPAMSCAEDSKGPFDERAQLQQYAHDLNLQCDDQVEYLATVIPADRVKALRKEHYEWRLERDFQCVEAGR